ncbi:hypothetical protein ACF061_06895 [Streptomyces sp. NPDC015220]|uniref:hypothetical protein n=1 Tax=Streptomyces sp. NPDC015220 TaxID=3364947 RepID=UPI0036FC8D39
MEQRIGSSSRPLKSEPVKGAGSDPAFIPGLTSPAPAGPADAGPRTPVAGEAAASGRSGAEPARTAPAEDAVPAAAPEQATGDGEDGGAPDGPVFEAADRRARIVADHRGVRLALDDQECEFRWDEIGALETETPRFGKRFTVTVHTPDRRWYPIEIEAPARSRFSEWETRLDAVLDAYFDDGADGDDGVDEADDASATESPSGEAEPAAGEEPSTEK